MTWRREATTKQINLGVRKREREEDQLFEKEGMRKIKTRKEMRQKVA
jgi:hypothetical protein